MDKRGYENQINNLLDAYEDYLLSASQFAVSNVIYNGEDRIVRIREMSIKMTSFKRELHELMTSIEPFSPYAEKIIMDLLFFNGKIQENIMASFIKLLCRIMDEHEENDGEGGDNKQ